MSKKPGRRKPPNSGKQPPTKSDGSIARARGMRINWHSDYILALRSSPSKAKAAVAAGIHRDTVNEHLKVFPHFASMVNAILETWTDDIEETAIDLSIKGCSNDVYGKDGAVVGSKVDYPVPLMIFMLKSRRREQYGDQSKVEVTAKLRTMTPEEEAQAGQEAMESITLTIQAAAMRGLQKAQPAEAAA